MDDLTGHSLRTVLAWLRYQELRAIVANLGLGRSRDENAKASWIDAIADTWLHSPTGTPLLEELSLRAQAALHRLCQGGAMPAALFWGEYGNIRRPGAAARNDAATATRPWRQPANAAEELFYRGLLFPQTNQPIDQAARVGLPFELIRRVRQLAQQPEGGPLAAFQSAGEDRRRAPTALPTAPPALVHDLAQWLIYLHQQPTLRLQHGRWLAPHHLQAVNQRLLHAARTPPRSHKRSPWLAFLSFLATAAALQSQGKVTAAGYAWLAATPQAQYQQLWDSWFQSTHSLRRAYALPAALLPTPWLPLTLPLLANDNFTPAQLSNVMLHLAEEQQPLFVAYLPDLHTLDQQHAQLLGVLATYFAAVEPAARLSPAQPLLDAALTGTDDPVAYDEPPTVGLAFQLTALGAWLLKGAAAVAPSWHWQSNADLTQTATALHIRLVTDSSPLGQAYLAAFAVYQPPDPAAGASHLPPYRHHYQLDEASVARAAAAQVGLPTLWEAFTLLGLPSTPALSARIQGWYSVGEQLKVTSLPVLQTKNAALMAQLYATAALRPLLGELLSPTVTVWHGEPAALLAILGRHGFYPDLTTWAPTAAGEPATDGAAPAEAAGALPAQAAPDSTAIGGLWLAAQLYTTLGHFLPLPIPQPVALLAQWFASLTPQHQAQLQAQLAHHQAHLQTLLDDLPLTPPPQPSDPAQWVGVIDAALAAGQRLQLVYFTAGRNLTTQRLVEPYWREEQHGIPYLRAYCHSAGRVLTFRLDRIQALEVVAA